MTESLKNSAGAKAHASILRIVPAPDEPVQQKTSYE